MRVGIFAVALVIALSITGCASLHTGPKWPETPGLPVRVELEDVPFYHQQAYQCGPAALAMALSWSGLLIQPEDLVDQVYAPSRQGSLQTALISAARRQGRVAYPLSGLDALVSEVVAGHPVIVLQNLGLSWYPVWHYAVVIGYDLSEDVLILHSGTTPRQRLSLRVFNTTWARSDHWGVVILEPSRLPATVQRETYLEAVVGLERAGLWHAAATAYQIALGRWPDSPIALIGLGNSLYATGELAEAEAVLRQAAHLHSHSGWIFNNLAYVLWKQGRTQEALDTIHQAIALGGPLSDEFQATLQEIQSASP